jgi:multisubunit Na+/H+ antiporter MnhC subunit
MNGLIGALNAIGSQVWAFLLLICGCAAVLCFHRAGIDIGIAAGIIGAAVNMFQSQASKTTMQSGGDRPTILNQVTEAPGVQAAPFPTTPTTK